MIINNEKLNIHTLLKFENERGSNGIKKPGEMPLSPSLGRIRHRTQEGLREPNVLYTRKK